MQNNQGASEAKMRKRSIVVLFSLVLTFFCTALAEARVKVSVTILPQAYFVERIGGTHVDLRVIVPPGGNPETYEPSPSQLFHLSSSQLYIKVGSPHLSVEKRFQHFIADNRKNIRVVDMSSGLKNLKQEDPHIWLSPAIVAQAARNVCLALSAVDPAHAGYYRKNLLRFSGDIDRLDRRIKQRLQGKTGYTFMVYHPAWGYFAEAYGLRQLAMEEEGKPLNASRLRKMIDLAKSKGIKTIFVQKGFDKKSAAMIAREIKGAVVEIDPLAKDWLKNLDDFSRILEDRLRP